ncbi:hypothetical protein [Methanobacterium oryzae]|uniref:hypothetical protein n=1 Tax=Methanobacterium oryzae TaxID=69540 RepID=UPI003D2078D4
MKLDENKIKSGILAIISILVLIQTIFSYLNTSNTFYIPIIVAFLIVIISILFELTGYYNKTIYMLLLALSLAVMWLLALFYFKFSGFLDYIGMVFVTLVVMLSVPFILKKWEKSKFSLK